MGEAPDRIWIPRSVLELLRGDPLALCAYMALAIHADARGRCWPTHKRLRKVSGMSRNSLQRALDRLQRVLEPVGFAAKRTGRSTMYQLPLLAVKKGPPQGHQMPRTGVSDAPHRGPKYVSGSTNQEGSGGKPFHGTIPERLRATPIREGVSVGRYYPSAAETRAMMRAKGIGR